MTTCQHHRIVTDDSSICCFNGSVSVSPYTEENRAAHGNVQFIEVCQDCGHERRVNSNNGHSEFGPWGISRAERLRQEKQRQTELEMQREDDIVRRRNVRIVRFVDRVLSTPEYVEIVIDNRHRLIPMWQLENAASQQDTGDEVVAFYRGLLRKIAMFRRGHFQHETQGCAQS